MSHSRSGHIENISLFDNYKERVEGGDGGSVVTLECFSFPILTSILKLGPYVLFTFDGNGITRNCGSLLRIPT